MSRPELRAHTPAPTTTIAPTNSMRLTRGPKSAFSFVDASDASTMALPSASYLFASSELRFDVWTSARFARDCSATELSEPERRRFSREISLMTRAKRRAANQKRGAAIRDKAREQGVDEEKRAGEEEHLQAVR